MPTYTYREPGAMTGADALRLSILAAPLGVLLLLLWQPQLDPQLQAPGPHFIIVTLAAGMAALLGLMVMLVGERLQETRAFSLGLAFCSIASFFFIHGLLTPGFVVAEASNGIGWAPLLALLLGAICLAFSTVRQRPGEVPWVFRYRKTIVTLLFCVWAAFLVLSIAYPRFLAGHPTSVTAHLTSYDSDDHNHIHDEYGPVASDGTVPWIAGILVVVAGGLLLFTALRYARNYRLSRLPLHATIVVGIVLLIESLLSFFFASVWRVSWWEYHVLVLLGFGTILYGLVADYRRDASLTRTISALLLNGSVEALEHSYSEVLTALVAAVEAKDSYTKGHSEKVARLAVEIGEHLSLPPERLRVLYEAGLLHDIGKIGIPDEILNKRDVLTESEFAVVRGHPARSEEMIGRIPSLRSTLKAIRWHHERLDGSGYPDGVCGDAIPLEARILAVADVFDAMRSGRSYRPPLPEQTALGYLSDGAGTLFDARCVDALTHVVERHAHSATAGSPEPRVGHLSKAVPHQT